MNETTDTLPCLRKSCTELAEAIQYTEESDLAYTKHYTYLVRKLKTLMRTVRKLEKLERKYNK